MKFDALSLSVLSAAIAATLWLLIYVRWVLPRQVEQRFLDSMAAFSRAVELRFPGHSGLTEDVEIVAVRIGERFGLDRRAMVRLKTSCRLMDIGLCALPYKLINQKPSNQWTGAEQATYDRHPEISAAMLELLPSLQHLSEIVRAHHLDYQSRPDMPVESRILKVCVDYAWGIRQKGEPAARDGIEAGRGSLYCPEVVEALDTVLTSTRVRQAEQRVA